LQFFLGRYAAQLQALSRHDPLTGLLNRGAFEIALEEELQAPATRNGRCRVLLMEVEGDDATVTAAASSLSRSSRTARGAARLGHGELAVLLSSGDARTPAEIVGWIEEAVGDSGVRTPTPPLVLARMLMP
jgi:GGDEF domain-containing protein